MSADQRPAWRRLQIFLETESDIFTHRRPARGEVGRGQHLDGVAGSELRRALRSRRPLLGARRPHWRPGSGGALGPLRPVAGPASALRPLRSRRAVARPGGGLVAAPEEASDAAEDGLDEVELPVDDITDGPLGPVSVLGLAGGHTLAAPLPGAGLGLAEDTRHYH